jgi:hypothetical protein
VVEGTTDQKQHSPQGVGGHAVEFVGRPQSFDIPVMTNRALAVSLEESEEGTIEIRF